MAGISKKKYKTKKGIVNKYVISYRDIFGKQHTSGLYDTIKEAKKDLWKYDKVETDKQNTTYGEIFSIFLKKAQNEYAQGTFDNYNSIYERFFENIKDVKYDKISSIQWQEYFYDIETKSGPYVQQTCLKFVKAAANYAMLHNLIEYNVFLKIKKAQLPKADINHLTVEELKQVLDECKKSYPQYYALLYTFIGTGAREGEIFALTKDDFDSENLTIRINKQYTNNKLYPHPKTASSNRYINIFEELAEVLKEHIKRLDKDNPLLFPNRAGNYHNPSNFRERFWYKLLELCGIEKRVRIHDLRGSYIDLGLANGLSVKFVQNQVGHSKAETTLNIYAKNNNDMIIKARSKINNIFSEKCENNVRIKENPPNKKIIRLPKRLTDINF